MKIKIVSIIKGVIFFIMILNLGYSKMFHFKHLTNSFYINLITSAASLGMFLFCRFRKSVYRSLWPFVRKINLSIGIILFLLLLECSYTVIRYNQGLWDLFTVAHRFSVILLVYPIVYIFICDGGDQKFTKYIVILLCGSLLIRVLSWYLYNFQGAILFKNLVFEFNNTWTRAGLHRIMDTSFGGLGAILAGYYFISEKHAKKRLVYGLCLALSIFFSVFVYASRAQLISILFSVFIMYVAKKELYRDRFLMKWTIVLVILFLVFGTGYIQNLIGSFSASNSQFGKSTTTRIRTFEYYYSLWKSNKLFGIGLLSINVDRLNNILRGPSGSAWFEDLGILGFVMNLGLLGAAIFLIITVRFVKITYRCLCLKNGKSMLLLSLTAYFLTSSVLSQCIFDEMRIFSLPFYLSIFEYINRELVLSEAPVLPIKDSKEIRNANRVYT